MASKCFKNRADTVLKMTRELSTLCGTPACAVIYDPNNVTNPWRVWPDDPVLFRRVVQLYKKSPKPKQPRPRKPPKSGSSSSTACSSGRDDGSSASNVKIKGFKSIEKDIQETICCNRSISNMTDEVEYHLQPPGSASTGETDLGLAGIGPSLAADNQKKYFAAGIDTIGTDATATTAIDCHVSVGEGMCEWADNDIFELLNSNEENDFYDPDSTPQPISGDGMCDCHITGGDGMCEWEDNDIFELLNSYEEIDFYDPDITSQPMTGLSAAVSGSKRKSPEQVFSFSELMAPSSQRRRIC